jgi:hypothetical protein
MKIFIDNSEIENLVQTNENNQEKIVKFVKKAEEIDQEVKKLGLQKQKVRDQMFPLVADEIKKQGITLGEFDVVESVRREDGKLVIYVFDQVEEYKEMLRKNKQYEGSVQSTEESNDQGEAEAERGSAEE